MIDLQPFVERVIAIVARRKLETGAYARSAAEADRANPYGSADAANLLYSTGHFPDWREHGAWIDALRAFQNPSTGLFEEETHHPLHTTAHVLGALELFGARPVHRLTALERWRDPAAMECFLAELDWRWNPWGESHKGAGLYAALVLAGEVDVAWEDRYFGWLAREADPRTGFWRRGAVDVAGDDLLFHSLAGSFHYLFNHEHARRPLPHPAAMVSSCIRMRREGLFPPLGRTVGYAELDWIYCLHRADRQSGAQHAEVQRTLEEFAREYAAYLFSLDADSDAGLNDLHQLLGAVSALAELQRAAPGLLRSSPPLRLVLDRRPFI